MLTTPARRTLAILSPAEVAARGIEGTLPDLPDAVEAERGLSFAPTVQEIAAFSWLAAMDGERIVAIVGSRSIRDGHRQRAAIEIVHIAGSMRGMVELIEALRGWGVPLIGNIALTNYKMIAALRRLGCKPTRFVLELEP